MLKLKDKVGIVTGAASGIGQAIALEYIREGAKVTLVDWNGEGLGRTGRMIKERGGTEGDFLSIEADVSRVVDIERFIQKTIARFGRIDILVNNAGIEIVGTLTDFTEEQWERLISINLKGVFFGMSKVLPQMMKQKKGKIINISSLAAVVGASLFCLYSTAKAGIIGLTRAAAIEYAPYKININALCPGFVLTGMTRPALEIEAISKLVLDRTPLEKIGDPARDIAPLALYLASDDSDFLTGQAIVIDGGFSVI